MKAKPFVKWLGGKTQLLKEIDKRIPFKITVAIISKD
jgi:site-specific DNA-adenine methylase